MYEINLITFVCRSNFFFCNFQLNNKFDPEDKHHIVRIYEYFVYQRHLCIAFELLDTNL